MSYLFYPFFHTRWRHNIDFMDLDMYDFVKFETVMNSNVDLITRIRTALSPFEISEPFPTVLATAIYDYCYGKLCNLQDTDRWKRNFLGEISGYILENGRYFQAFVRDVNQNIEQDDTSKVTTSGEEKTGTADTKKTAAAENDAIAETLGSNQQTGVHELGDTLTVLNNVTTSTNYLASANEESYSRGSVTESGTSTVGNTNRNNVKTGMENGASLSDKKDKRVTDTEGTKSPLTIALEESAFKFRDWFEPLWAIIDSYFTPGGNDYA